MDNEKLLAKYGNMTVIEMMKLLEKQAAIIESLKSEKAFAKDCARERRFSEERERGIWGIYG